MPPAMPLAHSRKPPKSAKVQRPPTAPCQASQRAPSDLAHPSHSKAVKAKLDSKAVKAKLDAKASNCLIRDAGQGR